MGNGVVIAGASQVKAGFGVEEVAAVAEGVEVGYMGSVGGDDVILSVQYGMIAPGIVFILVEEIAVFINDAYYIPLKIFDIVIIFSTVFVTDNRIIFIDKGHAARGSIGIDELAVIIDVVVGCTVDSLGDARSRSVIGEGIGIGALGDGGQLAAGRPGHIHVIAVLGGIAYLIVDYTISVKVSQ